MNHMKFGSGSGANNGFRASDAMNHGPANAPTPTGIKQVTCELHEQINHLSQAINAMRDIIDGGSCGGCEVPVPCPQGLDDDLRNAVERLRLLNSLAGELVARF